MKWNPFEKAGGRVYLDHAAATPVRKEVLKAMEPYNRVHYGNPSAPHKEGQIARDAIEHVRGRIARTLRVRASEVTFTSGGTEANNLAIYGVVRGLIESGKTFADIEIISTAIEHPSVLEVLDHLKEYGLTVHLCDVDEEGLMNTEQLRTLLSPRTTLITFAYANSETGVVQNVKHISHIVREFRKQHTLPTPYVHLDASQAPLWLPCQMDSLGVDLMTIDAGKYCGPKGIGFLAHQAEVKLQPIILGGEQETGLRAGTENTPLIVGCAKAFLIAQEEYEKRAQKAREIQEYAFSKLMSEINGAVVNGSREHRIANNINISIPGIDGEFAVVKLDAKGIAASTRSACEGMTGSGSHVVRLMSNDEERARSTIRLSLGEETEKSDIDRTVSVLKKHVEQMRRYQRKKESA